MGFPSQNPKIFQHAPGLLIFTLVLLLLTKGKDNGMYLPNVDYQAILLIPIHFLILLKHIEKD